MLAAMLDTGRDNFKEALQLACEAGVRWLVTKIQKGERFDRNSLSLYFLCRPLRGLVPFAKQSPGSAAPSPGAITLSASFAG
jgi:hypothetical protein